MTEQLFPPPAGIAHLYRGPVMHARLKPLGHRFSYKAASILVDIDQLSGLSKLSWLISHNRFNLYAIRDKDLGAADGTPLRVHVDAVLRKAGFPDPPTRVLLLTYPRILGFVFNPISIYWCYDRANALKAVIYEVRNTFGERHTYIAPVQDGELGPEGLKQERNKRFYVSPFLAMGMRYHFRLRPPGDSVAVRILETDSDGPILAATFIGARHPLTSGELVRTFVALPFLTLKIVAGIHWEAARLWLKGAHFYSRPVPPPAVSFGDGAKDMPNG